MKKRAYIIHKGELCAYNYRSSYIIAKVDLIDYLLNHSDDPPVHPTGRKKEANRIKSSILPNNQHSYY